VGGGRVTWRRGLLVLAALAVINLPWVISTYRQHQVSTDGVHVAATVRAAQADGAGQELITFTFPKAVDPAQTSRSARIDTQTYRSVRRSGTVGARVLKGDPSAYRLDGQIRSRLGGIVTLVGDAAVALLVLLSLRLGGRTRRPPLVAVALADVQEGGPDSLLDRQPDGSYVICGEIRELGADSMVLALRDRGVTIRLQGHANPVGAQQPAQVRAHLVG
jgi:hypothetical protein